MRNVRTRALSHRTLDYNWKGRLICVLSRYCPFLWNGQRKSNLFVHSTALSLLRCGGGDMPNYFSVGAPLSFRAVCLRVSSDRRSAYAHSLFLRQIYPVCAFSRFNRLCGTLHRDMGTPHLAVEMPGRRDQSAAAGSVKAAPYALGNHFGDVFLHDSVMERRLSFRRCGTASADAVVPSSL